jgi:hypothetical protein
MGLVTPATTGLVVPTVPSAAAAPTGLVWTTLDLSAPDWVVDSNSVLDGGSSSMGTSSTIVTNATHGVGDAGLDGVLMGWQISASFTWADYLGVLFEITADKPTGDGQVSLGGFISKDNTYTNFGGYRGGVDWNGPRSACRPAIAHFGSTMTTGGSIGAPSSATFRSFMPFESARPAPRPITWGSDEECHAGTGLLASWTELNLGLWLDNGNATAVTWANVVLKYALIAAP